MKPTIKDKLNLNIYLACFFILLALAVAVFTVCVCISGQQPPITSEEAIELSSQAIELSSQATAVSSDVLLDFFSYIELKDWDNVNSLLTAGELGLDVEPSDDHAAALWKIQQNSWGFSVSDDVYLNGKYMVGSVSVHTMDFSTLPEYIRPLINKKLEQTVASAKLKSEIYDENGNYNESLLLSLMNDSFYEVIAQPEQFLVSTDIQIKTELVNGKWRVCADNELIKALTGVSVNLTGHNVSSDITEAFESYVNSLTAESLSGLMYIPIVYSLAEGTVVAPAPDKTNFHKSKNPADTADALETATAMAGGQDLIWSANTKIIPGEYINWYQDETIFTVTWRQRVKQLDMTFCEVVIAHPSQFRRYLSDNSYKSSKRYRPTQMAKTVNAVVAISGDFYKYRKTGIVVYQRELYRSDWKTLDTCFVDSNGNLKFVRRGELKGKEMIRSYIEENDILFSLSFGPVMIEDGVLCVPKGRYPDGEIHDKYTRCALCQLGDGHYLIAVAKETTLDNLASVLLSMGVKNAYGLDGGQTATIVINGKAVNPLDHGEQRVMSDIIYFATAVPDGE